MFFLTPKYIKNAKLLHKGVTRFINYKRDVLPATKLEEIANLRRSLEEATKKKDKDRLDELTKTINDVCNKALPHEPHSAFADNVEVFFVAIVIALGIRAYIAQPFKIPTGSMQPTLNGINVVASAEPVNPTWAQSISGWFTGTSYFEVKSNHTGRLSRIDPITEHNFLLWSFCKLHFEDGHTIWINAPLRQLMDPSIESLGLEANTGLRTAKQPAIMSPDGRAHFVVSGEPPMIKEGQLLARGTMHSGDHVLVNKFAYHFRQPTRGEVFVFTTKHISYIEASIPKEEGSQHYIKRLAGVPGDKLQVMPPKLFINGKEAEEPGFKRVMQGTEEKPVDGYRGYTGVGRTNVELGEHEYFAMGDNSPNSSDSRYWGTVPEQNLVGCALFCYWPLTKHWGLIR
ncbi:MAG: signal peptidase I [Verrucomicrobiales bacterium]|nr:signal peptidase I [Verrucomicrobiales bacterium]MCP5556720.1 signal peptidase I [Verrucomicrobiaceae bacterium]